MHTAAEIARRALHHLAELGLPPTPENYTRYYSEFLGNTAPAGGEQTTKTAQNAGEEISCNVQPAELLRLIVSNVATVSNTIDMLAADISQHNREIKISVDNLAHTDEKREILTALNSIIAITGSLYSCVEASHDELMETKQALDQVKAELKESRERLYIDSLTGTQNRRGMDVALAREIARSRRNATKLSIVMIDIDHFKLINDEFGHHAGDKALVHLTEVAKSVLRETDVLVRYGGEEFLVIMSDTDINGALFVLGRLKLMIHKTPMIYEGKEIHIRCSYGVAQLHGNENGHALVMRADKALYQAKQAGRDRMIVSD